MGDRDDFVEQSYRLLQNQELNNHEQQAWLAYLLRYLRGNKIVINSLPDVYDWKFTGDNIVFSNTSITVPMDSLYIDGLYAVPTMPGDIITSIKAVAVLGTKMYVTGDIDRIGGVNVAGIALFDFTTGKWEALSDGGLLGLSSTGYSLVFNGTDLYIGGDFNNPGGIGLGGSLIVKYDTTNGTWSGVGNVGVNPALQGFPLAMEIYSGVLYAGGNQLLGAATSNVAAYTIATNTWAATGSGITSIVNALEVDENGALYAGATGLYKYTGSAWTLLSNLGGGNCYALAAYENKLYFGGSHSAYLSWYDINTAAIYPFAGLDDNVRSILVVNGIPYVGGEFTTPGNQFIKIVDGQLQTLGTSPTGATGVLALAEYGDSVILGGDFTAVDNKDAKGLALYFLSLADLLAWLPTRQPSNLPYFAVAAPTVNDDSSDGFVVGDKWIDTTGKKGYELVDSAVGAAVWKESTISATDTQVVFADGDYTSSGSDALTWNKTTEVLKIGNGSIYIDGINDRIIIGDLTPPVLGTAAFHFILEDVSPGTNLWAFGTDIAPFYRGFRARGTVASPSILLANDVLVRFRGRGYSGTWTNDNQAYIEFLATKNWASDDTPTRIDFYTTPDSSVTPAKVLAIDENGLDMPERADDAGTPAAGRWRMYFKAGGIYIIGDDGTVVGPLGPTGVYHIDQSGGTGDTYGALAGTINGVNTTFTVSAGEYASGSLKVFLNGQLLTQGSAEDWQETTPASGTFDFVSIIPDGTDQVTAMYGTPGAFFATQPHIIDADGTLADVTSKFNTLLGYLENLGFLASA